MIPNRFVWRCLRMWLVWIIGGTEQSPRQQQAARQRYTSIIGRFGEQATPPSVLQQQWSSWPRRAEAARLIVTSVTEQPIRGYYFRRLSTKDTTPSMSIIYGQIRGFFSSSVFWTFNWNFHFSLHTLCSEPSTRYQVIAAPPAEPCPSDCRSNRKENGLWLLKLTDREVALVANDVK